MISISIVVKSAQGVGVTEGHPDPKIGPQVYLGPIKRDGKSLDPQISIFHVRYLSSGIQLMTFKRLWPAPVAS